jgi:hypothetical protein
VSVARLLALAALAVVPALSAQAEVAGPTIAGARVTPVAFEKLQGWTSDDHAAAFAASGGRARPWPAAIRHSGRPSPARRTCGPSA